MVGGGRRTLRFEVRVAAPSDPHCPHPEVVRDPEVDPGVVAHFQDQIEEIAGQRVDLLFCNRDEALTLTGTEDVNDAAEALSDRADQFAITLGAEGAILYDGNEVHAIPGRAVTAVDTFVVFFTIAGAVLYGITPGMGLRRAGELGCLAAAAVVGQFGPRLPLRQYRGLLAALPADRL